MSDSGASRLRRQLESGGFEARLYVKQLSQQSDGDRDLQEHRQRVQALAEETAQNLKRNVYQNYRQFIETAREISYLESEMYQLSHLLTEQKSTDSGCYSAFVVWARSAMSMFVDAFSKQVFDSKESLSTAAECVKVAKEHCQQLGEIGLDLTFIIHALLVKDIQGALHSYKEIIIEATKHRNSEEMWRRMNLMTPEALGKLKEEMKSCGVSNFEQYTGDDCWVNLSYTVVAFTKQTMGFLEEALKLYFPELHMVLLESLVEIILVAVQHVDYSLRCEQDPEKKAFIRQNASFLYETVLPVVERRFEEGVGKPAKQLQDLRNASRLLRVNPESTTSVV